MIQMILIAIYLGTGASAAYDVIKDEENKKSKSFLFGVGVGAVLWPIMALIVVIMERLKKEK